MVGVHANDLIELEASVLSYPVRVEHTEVGAFTSNTLLSSGLVSPLFLELADTLVDGLSVDGTLAHWSLATSSTDADSVDDISLGSLVTKLARLLGTHTTLAFVDDGELTELPSTDTHNETK